jgi:uncharacterized protein (UPF0332 family)
MELQRAQMSLRAAELCLAHGLLDSAVNRAYFAMVQVAIAALEQRGIRRREWTHKGVHSDFVQLFVRRRKIVSASFARALLNVMQLRHIADYQHPGVSQPQAERAVRRSREFVTLLQREVFHGPQTDNG